MGREKFDIDLRYGHEVEGSVLDLLLRRACAVFEVKADVKAGVTGNLCLEFEQWGRGQSERFDEETQRWYVPSGIAVTEAVFLAVYWDSQMWLFLPVAKMKSLMRRFYREGRVKTTGDNGNRSVLVPVAALLPGGIERVK